MAGLVGRRVRLGLFGVFDGELGGAVQGAGLVR